MALFIDEKKMVDESTFQFEDRIKSPVSRFIDTTPTFTTYYHINDGNTTIDEGFQDIASILGHRSPLRFNKISDFPIYGIEQVVPQLEEREIGLDITFESEGKILPNTIKPVQNDMFVIPVLKDSYVFRVTNISYDTVINDSYYKIEYRLEYIDDVKLSCLEKQSITDNVCILNNIGTEDKCIIEKESFLKIKEAEKVYKNILELFKTMYYNSRHNVMTTELEDGSELYDPFMCEFINNNRLLNTNSNLETIILTDQYTDTKRHYKYMKTVYNFIEKRDIRFLTEFPYVTRSGVTIEGSSFFTWHDKKIQMIDIHQTMMIGETKSVFNTDFVNNIKNNAETRSVLGNFIISYINNDDMNIKSITDELYDEMLYTNGSTELFFIIPLIMYIIRVLIKKEKNK